ncbi:MAG: hypothetical protein J6T10_08665 [Methanobrevibacter sp.]|nr:hypothetical protein [Methanobrevibacter sp.]
MILINITDAPNQAIQVPFRDGTCTVSMYYSQLESSWFMSVSYGDSEVNNILVEQGVNLLYPFRHMFSFGILCISNSAVRPLFIDSFATAESDLILLEGEENINI